MLPDDEPMWGWWSQEASRAGSGFCMWRGRDGSLIEVTAVTRDPEGKQYLWPDKVCLGQVIHPVQDAQGRKTFHEG